MPPSPTKTTSILPAHHQHKDTPATILLKSTGRRFVALCVGAVLVAGVVAIALTVDGNDRNNKSDSPDVAGAYAAAFASSPPLTVATYASCAELLAGREAPSPCPVQSHDADNAPRRIKEVRGGRCRSRDSWLRGGPALAEDAAVEDAGGDEDFSGTNVQEAGVDEADAVKTSGDFIYKVGAVRGGERSSDGALADCAYRLSVVEDRADGLTLVASVELEPLAITPEAMFVHGDVLLLYGSADVIYEDDAASDEYPTYAHCGAGEPATIVLTFDVADPTAPVLLRREIIEGSYVSARKVDSYAYLVLAKRTYWADARSSVPFYRSEDAAALAGPINETLMAPAVACDEVVYLNTVSDGLDDFTIVAAIDMANANAETTFQVVAGKAADGAVYAPRTSIYLALAEWTAYEGETWTRSVFIKMKLDGARVAFETSFSAPGRLLNQYAMSEAADGSFRAATTSRAVAGWWFDTSNNLYVFDADGLEIGSLEGLAPGETIKAARFIGDRCYLVTFVQTDPLFVISLEGAVPRVLGELKIPGFSAYLHPVNATHMLGIGHDADPYTGTERGLQFSLFDVSDELNPRQNAVRIVGDRGSASEALDDAKAFQFWSASDLRATGVSSSPGIFALPAQLASLALAKERGSTDTSVWATGATYYQGTLLFDVALNPLGNVTHLEPGFWDEDDDENNNYWWAYSQKSSLDSGAHVTRSLRRGDAVYTFSDNFVAKTSLDGRPIGAAALAANATYSEYDDDGYSYYVW